MCHRRTAMCHIISTKNILAVKKEWPRTKKRSEIKMGAHGLLYSVTADQNLNFSNHKSGRKTLNYQLVMFCSLTCDYLNFILISSNTTQALAAHFYFTSFLFRPFLVLGHSQTWNLGMTPALFHLKCLGLKDHAGKL